MAGIPPGIVVKLELWRQKNELLIDCFDASPDATVIIEKALLHVPIGQLDMSLFNGGYQFLIILFVALQ